MEETKRFSTAELMNGLLKSNSLDRYLKQHEPDMDLPAFHAYITDLCQKQGLVIGHVIEKSNIETSYGYQIFNGKRKPSRDMVLLLAFGFDGGVELAQTLLRMADASPLYPRMKRDAAILYCLHAHMSVVETQDVLFDLSLPLLGGKRHA